MLPEEVKRLVTEGLPGCEVTAKGDGSHFELVVVGEVFRGKSPVQRQRLVYAALGDRITSGEIHAVTIKAYTPDDWDRASKLQVSS